MAGHSKRENHTNSCLRTNTLRTISIDSYLSGVSIGTKFIPQFIDPRPELKLSISENESFFQIRRRYDLNNSIEAALWRQFFHKLSAKGELQHTEIYIGISHDPLAPFDERFKGTSKVLELLENLSVGKIYLQTRSPLIVLLLPLLKRLKNKVQVVVGLETNDDESSQRYTPQLPLPSERLKAVKVLQTFGISVALQVSPLLPYGQSLAHGQPLAQEKYLEDSSLFAQLLVEHADNVFVQSIHDSYHNNERLLKKSSIYNELSKDRKYIWLRRDVSRMLINRIQEISPDKLLKPNRDFLNSSQLSLFR